MAEAWANGHQAPDDDFSGIAEDMRVAGESEEAIERKRQAWEKKLAQIDDEDRSLVFVFPENFDAFAVFRMLGDSWEFPSSLGGGRLTVPASEILAVIEGLGLSGREGLFGQVKRMVMAAREVLHAKIEQTRAANAR